MRCRYAPQEKDAADVLMLVPPPRPRAIRRQPCLAVLPRMCVRECACARGKCKRANEKIGYQNARYAGCRCSSTARSFYICVWQAENKPVHQTSRKRESTVCACSAQCIDDANADSPTARIGVALCAAWRRQNDSARREPLHARTFRPSYASNATLADGASCRWRADAGETARKQKSVWRRDKDAFAILRQTRGIV